MFELAWQEPSNFTIMTLSVCVIVTINVYFTEYFISRKSSNKGTVAQNNMIDLPEFFHSFFWNKSEAEDNSGTSTNNNKNNTSMQSATTASERDNKGEGWAYFKFLLVNSLYFVTIFVTITVLHRFSMLLLIIQHISVFVVIILSFLQFGKPFRTVPLSLVYGYIWLISLNSDYRWVLNNTIVFMCILLTGYIRFKNFIYLQIFMWVAFFYDVYMLNGIKVSSFQLFSVREEVQAVALNTDNVVNLSAAAAESCDNLLCKLFSHDTNFKIPTAFSVQFGQKMDHVFIGTGDIMIGSFVANFAFRFFKKTNYMAFTVLMFGAAISMLSYVTTNAPFPALMTIVPVCTLSLIVLALWSNKSVELIIGCKEKPGSRKKKSIDELLYV